MMTSPLLDVRGLGVDIPTPGEMLHPVRGVDLSVAAGETLAIVGESGCGKSLTALSIMGLQPRSARPARTLNEPPPLPPSCHRGPDDRIDPAHRLRRTETRDHVRR